MSGAFSEMTIECLPGHQLVGYEKFLIYMDEQNVWYGSGVGI